MKLIFDFDHTLFSTKNFYFAIKKEFVKLGIDEKLFRETFEESRAGGRDYKPKRQLKLIYKIKPWLSIKLLNEYFQKILNKAPRFLYKDTTPFLKRWQKKADLFLLSYGEEKFQKEKITASGIQKYFKKVIITKDIDKSKPFKIVFSRGNKIFFFEDNPIALFAVKKLYKDVATIRVNRGEGKYYKEQGNKNIDFNIKKLKEFDKIKNVE